MIQSYNKPLVKEEEARVVQQDKDVKVIRRSWTREERLKAEFEVSVPTDSQRTHPHHESMG